VSISISEEQAVESPATKKDAPVVTELTRAIEFVYGNKVRPIGIGGGTVGAYLRKAGLNAAVWSRLDETAHQPNEYCVISHMTGDAKVLASVMCGSIC
jgi:succinyl-diaminopimelate desuccinylase